GTSADERAIFSTRNLSTYHPLLDLLKITAGFQREADPLELSFDIQKALDRVCATTEVPTLTVPWTEPQQCYSDKSGHSRRNRIQENNSDFCKSRLLATIDPTNQTLFSQAGPITSATYTI
ncbi:hypothetical protein TNCV_3362151, partial [Trichonephila clavipes]